MSIHVSDLRDIAANQGLGVCDLAADEIEKLERDNRHLTDMLNHAEREVEALRASSAMTQTPEPTERCNQCGAPVEVTRLPDGGGIIRYCKHRSHEAAAPAPVAQEAVADPEILSYINMPCRDEHGLRIIGVKVHEDVFKHFIDATLWLKRKVAASVIESPEELLKSEPKPERRWLVERTYAKGQPAEQHQFWLGIATGNSHDDSFNSANSIWTTNALEAARFSTEKIAQELRYRHFHPEAPVIVCEHIFGCGTVPE